MPLRRMVRSTRGRLSSDPRTVTMDEPMPSAPGDAAKLPFDLEQRVLGLVEDDEPRRSETQDLAAQLGSDRTPGTGHEHAAVGHGFAQQVGQGRHLVAAEQIGDFHVPGSGGFGTGDHGLDVRNQAHAYRVGFKLLDDSPTVFGGGGVDGDEHLGYAVACDQLRQSGDREDLEPVDDAADGLLVVVDECDRAIAAAAPHLQD